MNEQEQKWFAAQDAMISCSIYITTSTDHAADIPVPFFELQFLASVL